MDDFPYANDLLDNAQKIDKFKGLIDYTSQMIYIDKKYVYKPVAGTIPKSHYFYKNRGYLLLKRKLKAYSSVVSITEYFVDKCRAHCNFKGFLSPFNYYKQNKEKIIKYLKDNNIDITNENIRNAIYLHNTECSPHNPVIIKKFIEKYNASKIIDMSAGWGDRLIGSMASKLKTGTVTHYKGSDPNSCLYPIYKEMIDLLLKHSPNNEGSFYIENVGFENLNVENNFYDLAYTSPPYFDLEVYSNEKTQSISIFDHPDTWFEYFLKPSIIKIINAVKINGHIVLYINQYGKMNYMEKFFEWIKYVDNIYYYGCAIYGYLYDNKSLKGHPMYIYKKSSHVPTVLYNPKLTIINNSLHISTEIIINTNVIFDNNVIGGTHSRYIYDLLKKNISDVTKNITYIYTSNMCKYVCISVTYTLYLLKKKDIIFNISIENESIFSDIDVLKKICYHYHNNITFNEKTNNSMVINDLLDDVVIEDILYNNLVGHCKNIKIKSLWIYPHKYIFIKVLLKIFKNIIIKCVIPKSTIISQLPKYMIDTKIILYKSSYNDDQCFKDIINYESDHFYDAKIYEFIKDNAESGDYIWNTANIDNLF